MCTNDHILAAQRLAEFVEVDCVGLEGVRLDGTGRSILVTLVFSDLSIVTLRKALWHPPNGHIQCNPGKSRGSPI
jgi:hypothetical protein